MSEAALAGRLHGGGAGENFGQLLAALFFAGAPEARPMQLARFTSNFSVLDSSESLHADLFGVLLAGRSSFRAARHPACAFSAHSARQTAAHAGGGGF